METYEHEGGEGLGGGTTKMSVAAARGSAAAARVRGAAARVSEAAARGSAAAVRVTGTKTKSEADATKAEADEHWGQFKTLKDAMMDVAGAPVVGPPGFWIVHRIFALFTVVFFLYTFFAAVPSFSEKKTFADVEFLPEFQLPDVYMCLTGESMRRLIAKKKRGPEMMDNQSGTSTFTSDGRSGPTGLQGTSLQIKAGLDSYSARCGAYNLALYNMKTMMEDTGPCPVKSLTIGNNYFESASPPGPPGSAPPAPDFLPQYKDRMGFNAWDNDRPDISNDDANVTTGKEATFRDPDPLPQAPWPASDEMAGILAGLLPSAPGEIHEDDATYKEPNATLRGNLTGKSEEELDLLKNDDATRTPVVVGAFCFRNEMNIGAMSTYETSADLVLSMMTRAHPASHVSPARTEPKLMIDSPCASLDTVCCSPLRVTV